MRATIPLGLAALMLSSCASYNRHEARTAIRDLYPEFTLDWQVLPTPDGGQYRAPWEIAWWDADGHSMYDVPVVGIEYLTTAPMQIVYWGIVVPGSLAESALRSDGHPGPVTFGLFCVNAIVAVPCLALIFVEDTVIHDVPLTVGWAPALLISPPAPDPTVD